MAKGLAEGTPEGNLTNVEPPRRIDKTSGIQTVKFILLPVFLKALALISTADKLGESGIRLGFPNRACPCEHVGSTYFATCQTSSPYQSFHPGYLLQKAFTTLHYGNLASVKYTAV